MRTKNLKEQGITLVALVVTIIILLILAGVTINIALRENGLFKMARTGANKYEQSAINEQTDLDKITEEIDNIVGSGSSGTEQGNGGGTGIIDANEVSNNLKNYQGKYVDIGLDIDGQEGTTNDWEIFYVNEGRIFLIAADYVSADKLEDWEVIGDKGKLTSSGFQRYSSSNTYSVKWSDPPTFLKLPTDPNNYLDLVMHTRYTLNENKDNSKAVSQLLNKDRWSGVKDAANADKQDCIDFVIGGPTLEMWCAAWNKAVEEDTNGFVTIEPDPETNGTGYNVKHDTTISSDGFFMNGTYSKLTADQLTALETTYKTFFSHTGESGWNNCYGYWLASPSASNSDNLMYVRASGYVTGNHYDNPFAVRPLICLQSGVQLTETSKGSNIYNVSMQ